MLPKLFTYINVNKCSGPEGLTLNSNNNNNYKKKNTGDFYSAQSRAESWGTVLTEKSRVNYLYQNKNKKTNKAHHNYHTLDNRTIIQSTTAKKVDSPETTNCTNVYIYIYARTHTHARTHTWEKGYVYSYAD